VQWPSHLLSALLLARDFEKPHAGDVDLAGFLIRCGSTTVYFGFFGIFRLGAYVDVALVICALFLIVRLGSHLTYERA
jgi:hypothetical protein